MSKKDMVMFENSTTMLYMSLAGYNISLWGSNLARWGTTKLFGDHPLLVLHSKLFKDPV
jgi:hypothetical protein